jgi:hypothetical protein
MQVQPGDNCGRQRYTPVAGLGAAGSGYVHIS